MGGNPWDAFLGSAESVKESNGTHVSYESKMPSDTTENAPVDDSTVKKEY